jgi:phage terminase large subunit-like protein
MPTKKQSDFIYSPAKRKIVKAGRRGGKTVGVGILGVEDFLDKKRVLYAAPTAEQIGRFWATVTRALQEPIKDKRLYKNESEHYIEVPGTENRIKAKTAWNADSLRGDYADTLILDEWQLMNEDAWGLVGAPMMLDTNGDTVFIYTPPSLRTRSVSKANDPQHAAKLFKKISELEKTNPGRYAAFHFTSMDNPHLSRTALSEISGDMSAIAYRMEVLAEDVDEVPGALWNRDTLESTRVHEIPELEKIVVAVDPSASSTGDEAGIITVGKKDKHGYVLADNSVQGTPEVWAKAAITAFYLNHAMYIVAEKNNGGEMIQSVIGQVDKQVVVKLVHASKSKATRAEPVSIIFEQGRGHLVGEYLKLEDELCLWTPGDKSPNRLDAMVWGFTELDLGGSIDWEAVVGMR